MILLWAAGCQLVDVDSWPAAPVGDSARDSAAPDTDEHDTDSPDTDGPDTGDTDTPPADLLAGDQAIGELGEAFEGGTAGDEAGHTLLVADLDLDGEQEWIAAAPYSDTTGADAGTAYVIDGAATAAPFADAATLAVHGSRQAEYLGYSLGTVPDLLDAACAPLAIGAPGYNDGDEVDAGLVAVLDCEQGGTLTMPADHAVLLTLQGPGDAALLGSFVQGGLGFAERGERSDLALGAPGADGRGTVWVIYGDQLDGTSSVDLTDQATGLELSGEATGDYAGISGAALGDFTGDGFDDLVVGAPGLASTAPGKAHVVEGGQTFVGSGSLGDASWTLGGAADGERLGYRVAALGDLDGDGLADLAASALGADDHSGTVYLVHGTGTLPTASATVSEAASATLQGAADGGELGHAVVAFDSTGDGTRELAVGATGEQARSAGAGAVYVFSDVATGAWSTDDAVGVLYADDEQGSLGAAMAVLPATDGVRLLIADPTGPDEATSPGRVWSVPLAGAAP